MADVIIIDEAHHFRNPGLKGDDPNAAFVALLGTVKYVRRERRYLLTATPINNRLLDLQHMIELFSQRKADYFKAARLAFIRFPGISGRWKKSLKGNWSGKA